MMDDLPMRIMDISMEITERMPVYGGKENKKPVFRQDKDFSMDGAYETRLEMNMHTGTHIDAPLHIIEGGETLNALKLEQVVTDCKVLDISDAEEKISHEHLRQKNISKNDFILLKTRNSFLDILEGPFVYLDQTGAQYLKDKGIKGVGIDALGIERSQPGHETHKILLEAGIVILEGLRLKQVPEGRYLLIAAPIKIPYVEAAPVRAILIDRV